MATLTKERAKAPLIENGSVSIRKQYAREDWDKKTFSFDLTIAAPWTDDPVARKARRDYTIRMTADDALRLARAIITDIHDGMDLVKKEPKR